MNSTIRKFHSSKQRYTIIDVPGHRDYIKNMISATSQADCAILMISSQAFEFEAGISKQGQTKEHALLSFTLGVKKMVVAVNKMDIHSTEESEQRYNHIVERVQGILGSIGYKSENVSYVPISGYTGENLIERSQKLGWYKGKTLVATFDELKPPKRLRQLPLRLPINDVFRISGVGTVLIGTIRTGCLKPGMMVHLPLINVSKECSSIEMHYEQIESAGPGDNVGFKIRGISYRSIRKGDVACDLNNNPASLVDSFTAYVVVLNHPGVIKAGYTSVLHCHSIGVQSRLDKLITKIDQKTGKTIEDNPAELLAGDSAMVELTPLRPVILEAFKDFPPLGRFAIRDQRQVVMVGIIKSTVKKKPKK